MKKQLLIFLILFPILSSQAFHDPSHDPYYYQFPLNYEKTFAFTGNGLASEIFDFNATINQTFDTFDDLPEPPYLFQLNFTVIGNYSYGDFFLLFTEDERIPTYPDISNYSGYSPELHQSLFRNKTLDPSNDENALGFSYPLSPYLGIAVNKTEAVAKGIDGLDDPSKMKYIIYYYGNSSLELRITATLEYIYIYVDDIDAWDYSLTFPSVFWFFAGIWLLNYGLSKKKNLLTN